MSSNRIFEYLAKFHYNLKEIMDIYDPVYRVNSYNKSKSKNDILDTEVAKLLELFDSNKEETKEDIVKYIAEKLNIQLVNGTIKKELDNKQEILKKCQELFIKNINDAYLCGILTFYKIGYHDNRVNLRGMNPKKSLKAVEELMDMIMSLDAEELDTLLTVIGLWDRFGNDHDKIKEKMTETIESKKEVVEK